MDTWTPLWGKVVDSSLWMEELHVRILFVTMLALKDRDHVVRKNPFELSRRANLTMEQVKDALQKLQDPDRFRVEGQEQEGRRVQPVEDGFLVINGEKYRKMMTDIYRRQYLNAKNAEYRERKKEEAKLAPPLPAQADMNMGVEVKMPFVTEARVVIQFMNELSGKAFREVEGNLTPIIARFREGNVTLDGCKQMVARQWVLWKDALSGNQTPMREYFQPTTLFGKQKFDGYYGSRELPVEKPRRTLHMDLRWEVGTRKLEKVFECPVDEDGEVDWNGVPDELRFPVDLWLQRNGR